MSSTLPALNSAPATKRLSRLARYSKRIGIAFLVLGLIALGSSWLAYRAHQLGSICGDGWESESTGPGRCSNHDGVAEDIFEDTVLGVSPDRFFSVSRWSLALFGTLSLGAGAAVLTHGRRERASHHGGELSRRVASTEPLSLGILELTARVSKGGAGQVIDLSVDGGPSSRAPFFFRIDKGRGAPRLAELMRTTGKRRFGRAGRRTVEVYGTDLFHAIFPDPLESRYREALTVALRANTRLRILLDLDDRASDLPWEYLYDPERGSFLAMSQDTSVIRFVNDDTATRSCEPVDQLRVLVMTTSPRGLEAIDVDGEVSRLEARLAEFGEAVVVHRVAGETLDDLRQALTAHAPHVFHFVGHGDWDDTANDGAVVFADEQGSRHGVSGRDLGVLLNRPELRLVLFNSCNAARTSQDDRFAGVAGSLVAQGVPAAIGMQYPIEDRSAASFGVEFLAGLLATHSVDQALTDARSAVFTGHTGLSAIEWATPALTIRVPVDDVIPWASPACHGN